MSTAVDISQEIGSCEDSSIRYSLCTLVTRDDEYSRLVEELIAAGFTLNDCEYFFADNTKSNLYDAFSAYNKFLMGAKGKFIILCHQDIAMLSDGRKELDAVISRMDGYDRNWALLGNAGGDINGAIIKRITDPLGDDQNDGPFPACVTSLDENFIVAKRSANLALSRDLAGFHFYGTELCLNAAILGYNAYVVDFHLCHKSRGVKNESFYALKDQIIAKYAHLARPRWIRSTCAHVYISHNHWLSLLLNSNLVLRLVARFPKVAREVTRMLRLSWN